MRRLSFAWRYVMGRTPWDTQETPPEVTALIEQEKLSPGRALEVGCGTGTNAIYLARHGWQVTAIDFVRNAIRQARRKARRAGVGERTEFLVGDVTRLGEFELPSADFALDIGCLHSLTPDGQRGYAAGLSGALRPGATYLLYAFEPREGHLGPMGVTLGDIERLFGPRFRIVDVQHGLNESNQADSAWYRLERVA